MEDVAKAATEPAPARLVLMVEDDILIRMSSADVLRDAGYKVIEADNGEEALSLLHAGMSPDLIISDIRMPGAIDGLKLLELVQKLYPVVPVLLASSHLPLTGDERPDVRFLPKPYTGKALVDLARSLIRGA
jgi:CheY-like chemotaxis protein